MKLSSFLPVSLLSALAAAGLLLTTSCSLPQAQADPTRYYVLTTPKAKPATDADAHVKIALRTVQIPSFLRGKSMQVRVGGNEITYADESRWAETLEAGIGRVLRESLEERGPIAHVVASSGEEHDFDVLVTVLQCEGDRSAGVARFTAAVEIISTQPGAARRARDTFTTEVGGWDGQNYGQLAQKLSEAVDQLAERIAKML